MDNRNDDNKNSGIPGIVNDIQSAITNFRGFATSGQKLITQVATSNLRWYTIGFVIIVILIAALFGGDPFPIPLGGDTSNGSQTTNPGTRPTGTPGACPATAGNRDPGSCKYLNPAIDLFSTDIPQSSLDTYINRYAPTFVNSGKGDRDEFVRRVNHIVERSKEAGLTPVLFLGYWKSESLFGTVSTRELGCAGTTFEDEVDCALGIGGYSDPIKNPIANCARSKDENSIACKALKEIRKSSGYDALYPISYPIATFDDFAEAHGPFAHDPTPEKRKGNCTSTYNILLEVAAELNACTIGPGNTGPSVASSCPIPNGVVTCGSQNTPVINGPIGTCGHCGVGYNAPCDYEGTKSAMDIDTPDRIATDVVMPEINGHAVDWTLNYVDPRGGDETIYGYAGKDTETGDLYYLQYSHVKTGTGVEKRTYKSGEIGAKTCTSGSSKCDHLHVQLAKGGSSLGAPWADAMQYFCGPAV